MTTALERFDDAAPRLNFGALVRMGDALVSTGFLPAHLRTGAQVAAVILTGRELGMEPMRAIRSLSLLKGKVIEAADSQLARFKSAGGRAQWRRLDDQVAELWLRHPNGDEHVEVFGIEDAQRAGIASEMYRRFPRAMLRSRCITAGLKSLGWEGGVGTYDPDELPADDLTPGPAALPVEAPRGRDDGPDIAVRQGQDRRREAMSLEDAEGLVLRGVRLGDMSDERLKRLEAWAVERDNRRLAGAIALIRSHRAASAVTDAGGEDTPPAEAEADAHSAAGVP
jgi:hypothetical protein